jgi:hypothetical protein
LRSADPRDGVYLFSAKQSMPRKPKLMARKSNAKNIGEAVWLVITPEYHSRD